MKKVLVKYGESKSDKLEEVICDNFVGIALTDGNSCTDVHSIIVGEWSLMDLLQMLHAVDTLKVELKKLVAQYTKSAFAKVEEERAARQELDNLIGKMREWSNKH